MEEVGCDSISSYNESSAEKYTEKLKQANKQIAIPGFVRCENVLLVVLMLQYHGSYHSIRCQIQVPAFDVGYHFDRMVRTTLIMN